MAFNEYYSVIRRKGPNKFRTERFSPNEKGEYVLHDFNDKPAVIEVDGENWSTEWWKKGKRKLVKTGTRKLLPE